MVTTLVSASEVMDLIINVMLNLNELSPRGFCAAARRVALGKHLAPSKAMTKELPGQTTVKCKRSFFVTG